MSNYFKKMMGMRKSPPREKLSIIIWAWIGSFIGVSAVAYINFKMPGQWDGVMIIGSFGASAVLIYGAIDSPLAQPRNLVGGHMLSAVIGVFSYQMLSNSLWLAAGFAVATAILVMYVTKTLHPPGGATALIAVIGSNHIHDLGYWYSLVPVGAGALIMLFFALLINNIPKNRRYPVFWY
ncbi:MAG: HPP family protein [Fibrobacteria bacterium]|nr:HPP family protein [Fibrobacteria bacterium]